MSQKPPPKQFVKTPINGTKHTLLISSAKGGVGKSTVAVNLAFALQNLDLKIGILDADVYGPSLPKLMKINEKPKSEDGIAITPVTKYGAQCMSMGLLVDEQTPMIWRGPMVISAIKTMTQKVLWKERDIIIISLSFHKTFCVIVLIALITIGPLHIIGVNSSTNKPIDMH